MVSNALAAICSPIYTRMLFEELEQQQPKHFTSIQKHMFQICPNEIDWYRGGDRQQIINTIRKALLNPFIEWLDTRTEPFKLWQEPMIIAMHHLCNLLFRLDFGDKIGSNEMLLNFQKLINSTIGLLSKIVKNSQPIKSSAIPLTSMLTLILFYCTLDANLLVYIKGLDLVKFLLKLINASNNDNEIEFCTYRILAAIMTENDIKTLANPSRIVAVFIQVFGNVIDGGKSTVDRLHNTLRSLKVLIQHDQIRDELAKQGGLSLLRRCAIESKFDPLKAQQPSLKILIGLAFDKDIVFKLKNDEQFMKHLRILCSSDKEDLQRTADNLLWKLEKEMQAVEKSHITHQESSLNSNFKYDVMMSYSHRDKDLCWRIQQCLVKDGFHVWLDRDNIHTHWMAAISDAIDNSEFVVICMSNDYKKSMPCCSEANYAYECQRELIPLIVKANYKPDGWLHFITAGKIYVDFPKLTFENAYVKLKNEINEHRKNHGAKISTFKHSVQHQSFVQTVEMLSNPNQPITSTEYPHCVDLWTKEHVHSFLNEKNLNSILPVFDGMNGRHLHESYMMCRANSQAMYLSFKEDVARVQQTPLLLDDYLRFLDEIKHYVPLTAGGKTNNTAASVMCNIM